MAGCAPARTWPPSCPTIAVSTIPSSGSMITAQNDGTAILKMSASSFDGNPSELGGNASAAFLAALGVCCGAASDVSG